jgi:hypothetical protein
VTGVVGDPFQGEASLNGGIDTDVGISPDDSGGELELAD